MNVIELQRYCENLVKFAYHENGKDLSLPIDICMIAQYMNIDVERENLNLHRDFFWNSIAQLLCEEDKSSKKMKNKIVVDNRGIKDIDYYSNYELFGIARELGKYIIEQDKYDVVNQDNYIITNTFSFPCYKPPMLYAHKNNIEYEMCAMFLMLPMEIFLDEFLNFIYSMKKECISMDKWLPTLSKISCIPYIQLANSYFYFRYVAYLYYQEYYQNFLRGKHENMFIKKYGELFR